MQNIKLAHSNWSKKMGGLNIISKKVEFNN